MVLSRRLQQQMTAQWTQGPVELAMRYGEPSLETTLTRLAAQGIQKVTLAPLYPQFADAVTTVIEEAKQSSARQASQRTVRSCNLSTISRNISMPWWLAPALIWSRISITCCSVSMACPSVI